MSRQPNLFETDLPPWEETEPQNEELVATIVFATGPDQPFDYTVPERLIDLLEAGRRVRVPFGRGDRLVTGYCVQVETKSVGARRLKALHSVVDKRTLASPAMLRLTKWMADYYLCSWGQVLETVVPAGACAVRPHA